MIKKILPVCLFSMIGFASLAKVNNEDSSKNKSATSFIADADNAGLKLPNGFGAIKLADNVGRSRHINITSQGIIYVKSSRLVNGKGIFALKEVNGKTEIVQSFGNYTGTGITVKNGYLYACSDEQVFRYKLNDKGEVTNPDAPEIIITGLINRHQHENKTVALDNEGNIYVNVGAYSNSCQVHDRSPYSPGMKPCPILDSAGGIWMFKADKLNQTYGDGIRYATGLRNVVGLDWNTQTNSLFVMQHGRDQLFQNWPKYYDSVVGAELPSECMFELYKGSNCGWPFTYYNHLLHQKMIAPEYGGDGKKVSTDPNFQDPVVAFPGHMAPNDILFYTGNQFPERYKNGAFIAFHGSWNRAPLPQKGYFVVFQPFKNGKPSGDWEIFADGFSGKEVVTSTRSAEHRPCGLAQGPDGSLYVCDDNKGTIYKITFNSK